MRITRVENDVRSEVRLPKFKVTTFFGDLLDVLTKTPNEFEHKHPNVGILGKRGKRPTALSCCN